jgi:hypothetical protein
MAVSLVDQRETARSSTERGTRVVRTGLNKALPT